MALGLNDKKQIVSDVSGIAEQSCSVIAADYRGLTVTEMTDLRSRAKEHGVYLRVVKNTLARRALENTKYQCLCDQLTGPLVFAFSQEDPTSAAKLFKSFLADNHDQIEVKLLAVEGEMLAIEEMKRLADLPSKDESISMLMVVMKAPLSRFAGTLSTIPAKLVQVLSAIQQQKQNTAV